MGFVLGFFGIFLGIFLGFLGFFFGIFLGLFFGIFLGFFGVLLLLFFSTFFSPDNSRTKPKPNAHDTRPRNVEISTPFEGGRETWRINANQGEARKRAALGI